MRLSAKTRYASRILLDLARLGSDKPIPASALSEHTGVSVQFVEQILKDLKKYDLTESVRGINGGHFLKKLPEQISLGDIVKIIEGGINLALCGVDDGTISCASESFCPTRHAWRKASKAMEKELDAISLKDLLDSLNLATGEEENKFPVCCLREK